MSDGWLTMWRCWCSDVRADAGDLPAMCPGHGEEPICQPVQDADHVPMAFGHRCHGHNCAELATVQANACGHGIDRGRARCAECEPVNRTDRTKEMA